MILIRLAGGLGNQIFQLGAGLLLAQKTGINIIVLDDSSLGNYDSKRENELLNFFDFSKTELKIIIQSIKLTKLRIPKLFPFNISKYPFVSDRNFQTILQNSNKSFILIDGYFQKCLTQVNFNEEIGLLKNIFIQNALEQKNGCVIHIRGGDFVKLGWNSVTPKEYYQNAIEKMKDDYNQKDFYIVTDDKDYSETILKNLNIKYKFIGNSIYEDFNLLGSFQYRILSSSTFSLWASALGKNDNSIVIAPKEWIPNHERKIYLPYEERIDI